MPILHWLDRDKTLSVSRSVPYKLLEEDRHLSYGDETPNMIVQGDNLEALKALLPYYAGQVKCIYIDPPYNTKSAFGNYDDNLEHSQWLKMMYPRLELLREFLREDGSIWISIDDNEGHYLKVIMDEIFGRKNFISNLVWEKNLVAQTMPRLFRNSMILFSFMQRTLISGDATYYPVAKNRIRASKTRIMTRGENGNQ